MLPLWGLCRLLRGSLRTKFTAAASHVFVKSQLGFRGFGTGLKISVSRGGDVIRQNRLVAAVCCCNVRFINRNKPCNGLIFIVT